MDKNLIFIGFMGCGKSTLGRKVSKLRGMQFVDTDRYIENMEGMKISEIFAQKGEEYFRKKETEVCEKFSHETGYIIATGGGIIKNVENVRLLKKNGVVIYLKASPEHIFRNVRNDVSRPLLQGGDKMEKIKSLMEERRPLYEKHADMRITVTGGNIRSLTEKILWELEDAGL